MTNEEKTHDEVELNSLAYLEQLGYTCIPEGAHMTANQEELEEEIDKRYLQTRVVGYQDGVGEILLGREAFGRIARHFAQWGAEHAKK